jgi:hypothetical protein
MPCTKFEKKYNKPHRCSTCGNMGHRADSKSCPKAMKSSSQKKKKKTLRPIDKKTIYTPIDKKFNHMTLRKLKQISYPAICKMSEAQSKQKLCALLLIKPLKVQGRQCWKCTSKYLVTKNKNRGSKFYCPRQSCRKSIPKSSFVYTPFYHMMRGGVKESYNMYLRAVYTFGLKTPQDAFRHYLGTAGEDSSRNWYNMIRIATAFAELTQGRNNDFGDGTLEIDATKESIRRNKSTNTHMGRFIIVYHRETKQYCLEPLSDKDVKKGAPPPPESYAEVKPILQKKSHDGNVLCSDSNQAIRKAAKDLKLPHARVIHKTKDFAHLVKMPLKYLSKKVVKRIAKLPTSTSRVYRLKAGGNAAEWTFSAIKRNLTRLNLRGRSSTAKLNFLSASWLSRHCGLEGVAKAIRIYQESVEDHIAPSQAFKSTDWLQHETEK